MFETEKGTIRPFKTNFVFMLLHMVTGKSKQELDAKTVDFIPTLRAASESIWESYSIHSQHFLLWFLLTPADWLSAWSKLDSLTL